MDKRGYYSEFGGAYVPEILSATFDELEAAFEPCAPLLEGVNFGFDRIFEAEFQDDLVSFSVCMRANGFDMPDPDFSALTTTGQLYPEEIDPTDPDFEPAFEACQDTLPGIPGISSP